MISDYTFTLILFGAAVFLVAVSACFVAAELSIVRIRESRLEELAQLGNRLASAILGCKKDITTTLSATQLGVTLSSIALGWVGERAFAGALSGVAYKSVSLSIFDMHLLATALSFFFLTVLQLVIGELVPKFIAIQEPERVGLLLALPISLFCQISRPLNTIFTSLAAFIVYWLGFRAETGESPLSEKELKIVMDESLSDGIITTGEAMVIKRALEFADKRVFDIMIPEARVDFISLDKSIYENLQTIKQAKHTIFPVCEKTFDSVIGVVHLREVWPELLTDPSNNQFRLKCKPATYVTRSMRQDHVMQVFQIHQAQLAIVKGGAGKNIGIVSVVDVVRNLVGHVPH